MTKLMTHSFIINIAAEEACLNGNEIMDISEGWSKVRQVLHMRDPLDDATRIALSANEHLRHWTIDPTPHNSAEEGYTDDLEKIAISFPR